MHARTRTLAAIALPAVALAFTLGCGGAAEEGAPEGADTLGAAADTAVDTVARPGAALEPDSFPDPIERDPCALVSDAEVEELTGFAVTAHEPGEVYVESYGARTAICSFVPEDRQAGVPVEFFQYELQHPIETIPGLRERIFENPAVTMVEGIGTEAAVDPTNDEAYANVDDTMIRVHCAACDDLEAALRVVVEGWNEVSP